MENLTLYNRPPTGVGERVWAYYRHSGQGQNLSSQITEVRSYCETHGHDLTREFADEAKSGTTAAGRHDFNRLVKLASEKHAPLDIVIFVNAHRLGRSQEDMDYAKAVIRKNGIRFKALNTIVPANASKPVARILEHIEDFTNEVFIEQLNQNIARGKIYRLVNGCVPVGKPKKGYGFIKIPLASLGESGGTLRGNKPIVNEVLGPLVIKAFEMKALNHTLESIAKQTGLFKGNSGAWHKMFRDTTYYGLYTYQEQDYLGVYPAIISKELFDAVQITLPPESKSIKNRRRYHPRRKGSSFIVGNIAFCGYCGSALEGKSAGSRGYKHYICKARNNDKEKCPDAPYIPAEELHENILKTLIKLVISKNSIIDLIKLTNECLDTEDNEITLKYQKTSSSLAQAKKNLNKMLRNFGQLDETVPAAKELLVEQQARVDNLQKELEQIELLSAKTHIQADDKKIIKYLTWIDRLLERAEYVDLREVIEQFCERIEITPDQCILYIKTPDSII